MTDPHRIAAALRRDFANLAPSADRTWFRPLALRLLDCVLSLRRHEDRPVEPRLEAFQEYHPEVESVRQLHHLLGAYRSPAVLARDLLQSNDPSLGATLKSLVEYLERMALAGAGSEATQLKAWAACARPQDYLTLRIPGFGLAGFQYLRMLLGANTTKPDLHIGRYVATALGRPVSDVEALLLLEEAAPLVPILLRDLTAASWLAPLGPRVSGPVPQPYQA
jgi:hypothetical protein